MGERTHIENAGSPDLRLPGCTPEPLMSIHGRLTEQNGIRGQSAVLSGKDQQGRPLSGHGHAYYLPTDEDRDGRIDHLTVFARTGFADNERRALNKLRQLNTGRKGEERHPVRLLLLGMGTLDEYRPGPLWASQVWVSATPYIATRVPREHGKHKEDRRFWRRRTDEEIAKAREKGVRLRRLVFADKAGFLEADLRDQIRNVLAESVLQSDDVKITPLRDEHSVFFVPRMGDCPNELPSKTAPEHSLRPIQFKRFRRKPGDDGGRRLAGAFRIELTQEVAGPIALGHSSHFGMGLFMPEGKE